MELPQIGQQCDEQTCKQLDFLPLRCKCAKLFCSEHFDKHSICCVSFVEKATTELKQTNIYNCSQPGCKTVSIVPLLCGKCNKHFCVLHRHIISCEDVDPSVLNAAKEKMMAPIRQFNDAKVAADKEVEEIIKNAKKKTKSAEMANKIQLMRIKNKATGLKTIPVADRIYFNIQHPSNDSSTISPIFVSKIWTLGKVIDVIAQELKLQNNNNQSSALKLRLFKQTDCEIVSKRMSDRLHNLLQNKVIIDGDTLVLEYVTDDCLKINIK